MRTKPTAQERPEPFHRIHMDFTQTIAIVISCELTPSMIDMLMTVAPGLQTGINAVFISINKCAWINSVFDQRLDGLLLHVREQIDHDLTATLIIPKTGGLSFSIVPRPPLPLRRRRRPLRPFCFTTSG